ncbi:TPA: capsule assembly Wzi family protein, partial [Klebsiella pneumoniae]
MPASAEPWVEVGDRALRSDIEILAARGLIDSATTTWPLPAGEFERLSDSEALQSQPEYVQLAARRVLERLLGEGQPRGLVPEADLSLTNHPDTIRDFGVLARDKAGGGAGLIWDSDHVSAGLRVNSQPRVDGHDSQLAFDGSYLSALVGNWQLYGGMVDQWYGPGWTSSLVLS